MGFTNYTNGVTSFGVPIFGSPALMRAAQQGAKVYFVDPRASTASDSKSGEDPGDPLSTVTEAEDRLTDESGDCIVYLGNDGGTGSSSRDTAEIVWDKSGCSLISPCAPVPVSQRARIAPSTSFADPLLTVSGHNNWFENFQLFQGHNAASTCLEVSGQRNYFWNVHVGGIGHATAGDDAASESLFLNGGSENLFRNCTIGLNTIARSAACAEIRCDAAATRNYFWDCDILCFADAAGALWVDIPGAGDIDRFIWFHNCNFDNSIDSTATTMTVGMNIHASAGGTVRLTGTTNAYGATDWANAFGNIGACLLPGSDASTQGLAINLS